MNRCILLLFMGILLIGCSEELKPHKCKRSRSPKIAEFNHEAEEQRILDSITSYNLELIDLVDIQDVNPNIRIELRYADTNNFMGKVLYDTLSHVYLQRDVAIRLGKVQDYIDSLYPGYRLLVYDGVRPLNVQQDMWDALDTIPVGARGKFVSNPAFGSVHNYGAAVDLTLCGKTGAIPLDMGAGYDDFRRIAFPSLEAHFLKTGELTKAQWENRKLLRKVMKTQRFYNIPSEWWHFNAYSRNRSEKRYPQLLSESGDSRYTKFSQILIQLDSLKNPEISDTISPL